MKLAPVIDELSQEMGEKARIGKVNVHENMDLAMKYAIAGVPTIIVFKDGEVVTRQVGATPKEKLVEMIEEQI